MARKKKGDGLFLLLYLALVAVAIATPVVLLIGFLYNWYKANQIRSHLTGSVSDFWLDDEEKTIFKQKHKQLSAAVIKVEKAELRGRQEGIAINMDGSFSARSNIGNEIRHIIEENTPIIENVGDELANLASQPQQLWEQFSVYVRREHAFLYSIFVWILTVGLAEII